MGHTELVAVRTYLNRIDAEIAQSALEAADTGERRHPEVESLVAAFLRMEEERHEQEVHYVRRIAAIPHEID